MRSLLCTVMFILSFVLCLAQTPVSNGPLGKMGPCPKQPDVWPPPHNPPSMQVIPAGEYEMGDHLGMGFYDELPIHAVYIDAFYMDTFEVTNKEYCAYLNTAYGQGLIEVSGGVVYKIGDTEPYCDTSSYEPDSRIHWNGSVFTVTAGKEDHPMVLVSWYGAIAYANWRSAQDGKTPCYDLETWECTFGVDGYRLPTEAEWEKASRGGEHSPYYDYPWGDLIGGMMANFYPSGDPYEGVEPGTTPVGYYDGNQIPSGEDMANGYGLYDMAGNVLEWCHDWYDDTYYQYCVDHEIYFNPKGPSSSPYGVRVFRGGSWDSDFDYLRCAFRGDYTFGSPGDRDSSGGFRLIMDYVPPSMQLITAGEFEMGDILGTGDPDEVPVHTVYIDAFNMGTYEVTNEEYCTYLNSAYHQGLIEESGGVVYKKGDTEPYCDTHTHFSTSRITWNGSSFGVIPGKADHPMVHVTWYGAVAYTNWLSEVEGLTPCYDLETWECDFDASGYRLPTEAEWEKASRGGEHNPYYDYPWGNSIDGSMANYWSSDDPYEVGGYPFTSPVGYYDGNQIPSGVDMANGYGLYDMAGNVWEYCNDWFGSSYYQYCVDNGINHNPKGPSSGQDRVLRGGSWSNITFFLRCAARGYWKPNVRFHNMGFRLAQDSYDPPSMQFIPEGEYEMGDHLGTGYSNELPVHAVYIDAFYMDTFEVTNEEYCAYLNSAYGQELIEVTGGVVYKKNDIEPYCNTTTYDPESRITWNGSTFGITTGKEDHPMVLVSWYGAVAYANWRSVQEGLTPCYDIETWKCNFGVNGYRLPTEAEWEKAARGGEHSPYYDYPWGNSIDGSMANYWDSGDPFEAGSYPWTAPVGYYDGNQTPSGVDMANGYGLYDMAGNVSEWCYDWYDETYYQYCVDHGIYYNPTGPSSSLFAHVVRGGAWDTNEFALRCACRFFSGVPSVRWDSFGFRLVLD